MTTTTHRYQSDLARRWFDQGATRGRVTGMATAVLDVLDAREIAVPEDVRERIRSCAELVPLDRGVRCAVTVLAARDRLGPEKP